MNDVSPHLRQNASDVATTALSAITSGVDLVAPGLGSFFGALITQVIPNQRAERFAAYVTAVSRRLRIVEGGLDETRAQFQDLAKRLGPEQRALFEDGAFASTRATSQERVEAIGRVVAEGLDADDGRAAELRRVVELIASLSDDDVIGLCLYTLKYGRDPEWRELHAASVEPRLAHMQSTPEELEAALMREIREAKLLRSGFLLERTSGRSTIREPSQMGRYVLRQLGLLGENEF